MKITCPSCSATGEIPDQSQSKPLRCRQCGTRFQPTPRIADDEQIIDVDTRATQDVPDLGIDFRIDSSTSQPVWEPDEQTEGIGPLKLGLTIIATCWNCFVLYILMVAMIESNHELIKMGESPGIAFLFSIMLIFFVISIASLGAFISYAKGRGLAEGYNLATFFPCFGIIVALCLPTNREGD
jgi:hypothetical protein